MAELRAEGRSYRAIGSELGVSKSTIERDVAWLEENGLAGIKPTLPKGRSNRQILEWTRDLYIKWILRLESSGNLGLAITAAGRLKEAVMAHEQIGGDGMATEEQMAERMGYDLVPREPDGEASDG